ncbi:MAG: hypothetical protein EBR09_11095 [Proteobacteria bacterium]|nr:hypothetical protein [Pseudomonadota bacterium]
MSLQKQTKSKSDFYLVPFARQAAAVLAFAAATARAEIKITPPPQSDTGKQADTKTRDVPSASSGLPAIWHFQATYGLSVADVECPAWDTQSDPATAVQKSTSGIFTDSRFGHSYEQPLNDRQSIRAGLSLFNAQASQPSKWMIPVTGAQKTSQWRTWGVGTDLFLVRRISANLDLDAGLQADYFFSGVTTLAVGEKASQALQNASRLDQKGGWRLAFTGGIGGLHFGPLGIIMRLSGQVIQAQFKGHASPLRVQGMQVQLGAGLALGRGEP